MTLNMGQWLSIPFALLGVFFIVRALVRKPVKLAYPNEWAVEKKKK